MAGLATKTFLTHLKSVYPFPYNRISHARETFDNPWDIIAAVAFSASNAPEAVPFVFKYASDDLHKTHVRLGQEGNREIVHEDRLVLARRFRDAIFKGGITGGFARAINGLMALHETMPPELKDIEMLRNKTTTLEQHLARGDDVFRSMYGETGPTVQGIMDTIYPDLGFFARFVAYGYVFGHNSVLSQAETSYSLVASLIAGDTPRQIGWHLANARRGGASLEQLKAVRLIAMEASAKAGVQWKAGVPEITDN